MMATTRANGAALVDTHGHVRMDSEARFIELFHFAPAEGFVRAWSNNYSDVLIEKVFFNVKLGWYRVHPEAAPKDVCRVISAVLRRWKANPL